MNKNDLDIKAAVLDAQLDKLVEDAHELREEVSKLKEEITYLTIGENIDKIFTEIEENLNK